MKNKDLRSHRAKIGSQVEVATLLGVHWTTISRWENGHQEIPKHQLQRLLELTPGAGGAELPRGSHCAGCCCGLRSVN